MPRILLVDDDIAEIAAVRRVLARLGIEVVLSTNATDAAAELGRGAPDLVLLAPACEGGEGAAVAREIAGDDRMRGVPVLTFGDEDATAPATHRLARPIDPAALEEAVREALEGATTATATTSGALARQPPHPRDPATGRDERGQSSTSNSTRTELDLPPPPRGRVGERVADLELDVDLGPSTLPLSPTLSTAPSEPSRSPLPAPGRDERGQASLRGAREVRNTPADLAASWFEPDLDAGEPAPTNPAPTAADGAAELRALLQAEAERAAREEAARERALAGARGREPTRWQVPRLDVVAATDRVRAGAGVALPPREVDGPAVARPFPAAGALSETSLPRLLALLARAQATGRLDLDGDASRSLWLEDGRIVGAASSAPAERAEEVALQLGLLTREQHRQVALAAAALASRRAGVLLLERGYLRGSELVLLARRRTEEILFAAAAGRGAFRFMQGAEVAPDERVAMDRGALALAVEAVRRRWQGPLVDAVLGGGATLLEASPAPPPLDDLGLSPGETRLAALADGLRTVDEILADAALDALSARQALAALVEVAALTVKVRAAASGAGPSRVDLARIDEKLAQVQRADYFVILGVPRDATPNAIRTAAERLLAEVAPGRFGPTCPQGVADRLSEIRAVVGEARDVLSDDELRVEYLAGLAR